MRDRMMLLGLMAGLVLGMNAGGNAEAVSTLFEKAVYAEETTGDLDQAIRLYQELIEQDNKSRRYVAQAHYRLAMCYVKKGDKTKAVDLLRTIVRQYPDQEKVLKRTEQQLAEMGVPAAPQPVVLDTTPKAFANDVNPKLKVIKATFDQPMQDGIWSWTGGGDTFPKTRGNPSYNITKTVCSLPVDMEPGKIYWVGVNSRDFQNFKGRTGLPARRYVILFATKDQQGKPTELPKDLVASAKAINEAVEAPPQKAAGGAPQMEAVPWADGEVLRLQLNSAAGAEMGTTIYENQKVKHEGTEAWLLRSHLLLGLGNVVRYTEVYARVSDFAPIEARTVQSGMGDYRADHHWPEVELVTEACGKENRRTLTVEPPLYDNEQAPHAHPPHAAGSRLRGALHHPAGHGGCAGRVPHRRGGPGEGESAGRGVCVQQDHAVGLCRRRGGANAPGVVLRR